MASNEFKGEFSLIDYGVFALSLLISLAVGLYYTFKPKPKEEGGKAMEFFMGSRKMPLIPTTMSMMASFISGILLLALPAQVYSHGLHIMIFMAAGNAMSIILTGIFFLPKIYKMNVISIYEYLEMRFHSRFLRQLVSGLSTVITLNYLAIVMYAPAVSLSAITGLKEWVFILSVGITCTFYTTIGGLKAVVWTDTLQGIMMYVGVFSLAIKGCIDAGGLANVLQTSYDQDRITSALNMNPSPLQYTSLWIAFFGGTAFSLGAYSTSQAAMQRYCSLPSLNQARLVLILLLPLVLIIISVPMFYGLCMFVYYHQTCDPLSSRQLKADQLVMNFVTHTLGSLNGLPGVFLASLCSGTLSTVSSGINALAAMTWEDFLRRPLASVVKEKWTGIILKGLVLVYGVASIALAFACGPFGGIITVWSKLISSLFGPRTGVFLVAMYCPWANRRGTILALVLTVPFMVWMAVGSLVTKPYSEYILPLNTCNTSNAWNISAYDHNSLFGDTSVFPLYRVSSYLYALIGICGVYVISLVASLLMPDKESSVKQRQQGESKTVI